MTYSRGSNNTTIVYLSFSSHWLCVFYLLASPLGTFPLRDVKDDYWPLGTPNLLQKEEKATLSPRVPIVHLKKFSLALLKSWVHLCLGDGVHGLTRMHYVPAMVG